jgi:hypothetical protein
MTESQDLITELPLPTQLTCRRRVLGTLGLAGLGIIASSSSADAFTAALKKGNAIPKVSVPTSNASQSIPNRVVPYVAAPDLPEEWAATHGRTAHEYLRYLNSLGLRRISPSQLVASHAKSKGTVWNTLPPKAWWRRMGYTLRVVERIAQEMNVSRVEVISAYRAPAYNARCGGKSGSWHQANVALDVRFPVRASLVTSTARELRDLGLFKGGVGGYWNFTHIDCRGKNINW